MRGGRSLGGEAVCDDGKLCRQLQRWRKRIEIASVESKVKF
jgi:hypothetical protein